MRVATRSIERGESKAVLYEQFARIGKALANPPRLHLLDLLAQGQRTVEELARAASMRLGNTSAQLRVLQQAGLVRSRRVGTKIYYRLAGDDVAALVEEMKQLAAARSAETAKAATRYLGDVEALEPVGLRELARRLADGNTVVVDVRPGTEYLAGHIPGAVSVPHDQLASRMAELPPDSEIIAYCRGKYCVLAPEAVRLMQEHGLRARPLIGGLPEWRRAGLPVRTGKAA